MEEDAKMDRHDAMMLFDTLADGGFDLHLITEFKRPLFPQDGPGERKHQVRVTSRDGDALTPDSIRMVLDTVLERWPVAIQNDWLVIG